MKEATEDEIEIKQELVNYFCDVSRDVMSRNSGEEVTKRFRQYYGTISTINEFCHLEDDTWFLGPLELGEAEEDHISMLSRAASRLFTTPGQYGKSIIVEMTRQLRPFSPLFEKELRSLIRNSRFSAPILHEVKWQGKVPYHGLPPRYYIPTTNDDSLQACLELEQEQPKYRFPYLTAFVYNSKHRVRNTHVTGSNPKAREVTRDKFKVNKGALNPGLHSDLVDACDSLIRIFGVNHLSITPDFSDRNLKRIMNKNTSSGFTFDTLYELNPTEKIARPKSTKKNATGTVIRLVRRYVEALNEYYRGETEIFPEYPTPAEEVEKFEIINQNFLTALEEQGTIVPQRFKKILLKTRLFYTSGSLSFIFDRVFGEWFSNVFRFFMSAIGIKVEGGGILLLFDMLNGGDKCPLREVWQKAVAHVLEVYGIDLSQVRFGEGDWSKYDFSLLFEILAHVGGLVTVPLECPQEMEPGTFQHLLAEFINRVCVKLLFMRGVNKHYYAKGTMGSGEFLTSIGNTVYQMVLLMMYFSKLKEKYAEDPVVQIILSAGMVMFFFYGDDHIGRWPQYMDTHTLYEESDTLLHDFINFCVANTGMTYKWESLKTYDYLYGVRKYHEHETGEVVEQQYRPSVGFLRYTVVHQFLNGHYLGKQVWRDTEDLIAKMSLSLSATSNPRVHLCHLASLARLSSGNLEAFFQIKSYYNKLAERIGEPTKEEWDHYYDNEKKLPFSIRMVISGGKIYEFPRLLDIHQRQREGFLSGQGFYGLDECGNPIDGSVYYHRVDDPRYDSQEYW